MPTLARLAGLALGAQVSFAAERGAAQTATLTGAVRGTLAPAVCGTPATGVPLAAFKETTPTNAPAASGTFELSIVSTCVAPFYQALLSQEAVNASIDLGGGYALSLTNARLTHVDVATSQIERGTALVIYVGIASTQVAAVATGSAPATTPTSAPPKGAASTVSPAAAAAVHQSGTTVAATPGVNAAKGALSSTRPRAPTIQLTPSAANANIPAAAGQSWAADGVGTTVHLVASSPALNATSSGPASNHSLSVHATVNAATGMPSAPFQINFFFTGLMEGSLAGAQPYSPLSAALYAAALARGPLTQAVITWTGNSQTGITLWLKSAQFGGGQPSSTGHTQLGSVVITASQLTITDIGSGRTASLP